MEFDELYQELILDHYKHPRRKRPIPEGTALVDEENPVCGDHIRLSWRIEDGRLCDVAFDGHGCAISMASASMLTERLEGTDLESARRLVEEFVGMMRGERMPSSEAMGDLMALQGVREFPMRIKCATLAWHAAEKALRRSEAPSPTPAAHS